MLGGAATGVRCGESPFCLKQKNVLKVMISDRHDGAVETKSRIGIRGLLRLRFGYAYCVRCARKNLHDLGVVQLPRQEFHGCVHGSET